MDIDDYLKQLLDNRLRHYSWPQDLKDTTLAHWRKRFDEIRKHEVSDEDARREFLKMLGST
jgi:hypothetical protein